MNPGENGQEQDKCRAEVQVRGLFGQYARCQRAAFVDGWCYQHHPDAQAARDRASAQRYDRQLWPGRVKDNAQAACKLAGALLETMVEVGAAPADYRALADYLTDCGNWNGDNATRPLLSQDVLGHYTPLAVDRTDP